jgi:hypothetical protein
VGWALGLAFVPFVLVAMAMRTIGVVDMPDPLKLVVALCFVVGMALAVLIIALWALADRS